MADHAWLFVLLTFHVALLELPIYFDPFHPWMQQEVGEISKMHSAPQRPQITTFAAYISESMLPFVQRSFCVAKQ